jgi:hypothetical protein
MRIVESEVNKKRDAASQAIPEIGKLSLGFIDTTNQGVTFPRATDYFVASGEYAERFRQQYGEKPDELTICFISDADEFSCSSRLELRDHRGDLYCYSDGITFYFRDKETKRFTITKTIEELPDIKERTLTFVVNKASTTKQKKSIEWKPTLYLRFMLPNFPQIGWWILATHGAMTTIPQVSQTFDWWKEKIGTVSWRPFRLKVKRGQTADKTKKYTYLNLLPDFSAAEAVGYANGVSAGLNGLFLPLPHTILPEGIESVNPVVDTNYTEEYQQELSAEADQEASPTLVNS